MRKGGKPLSLTDYCELFENLEIKNSGMICAGSKCHLGVSLGKY